MVACNDFCNPMANLGAQRICYNTLGHILRFEHCRRVQEQTISTQMYDII